MNITTVFAASAMAAAVAGPLAADTSAQPCAGVKELPGYPAPAFLENLWVEPDGTVLFTSYLAKEILGYKPGKGAATFARIKAFPISILPLGEGWLVVAHREPFVAGPGFTATNQFLVLDASGKVVRTILAPDARFLNGMVVLGEGRVLAADAILGRIWVMDVASGTSVPWLDDPALAADPAGTIHAVALGTDGAGRPARLLKVALPGGDRLCAAPG